MADINNLGKIIAVTGHYGSGKTNLAVNLAVDFAKEGERVTIIDLDIVNPYFRTADFSELFGSLDLCKLTKNLHVLDNSALMRYNVRVI